jgi:hypothetical protein
MGEDVVRLFDEFAARFARGERPDAREYLERAGEGREELAGMLDRFVSLRPPPEPDEEAVAAMRAWIVGEPPLLRLRRDRGVGREQVVDALVGELTLDPGKREKVADYYHDLEAGLLEPARVDRRVLRVVAGALRARLEDILPWPGRPLGAQGAFYRLPPRAAPPQAGVPGAPAGRAGREWDEVDELFCGAPEAGN